MVVEMFLDTADVELYKKFKHYIAGGTTNPSLMTKIGIPPEQYEEQCRKILDVLDSGVLSVEVSEVIPSKMYEEAMRFMHWGEKRIVVKIPCPFYIDATLAEEIEGNSIDCNLLTKSEHDKHVLNQGLVVADRQTRKGKQKKMYVDTLPLISKLAEEGVPLNVTCGFAFEQARDVATAIVKGQRKRPEHAARHNYFSIFFGRLLDVYAADPNLRISPTFNYDDLERMQKMAEAEVQECARQLEGTGIRIILGSARLPKIWEQAAARLDEEEQQTKEYQPRLQELQRHAYRCLIKTAMPVNAIPTVFPTLFEAARYHDGTSEAATQFIGDVAKVRKETTAKPVSSNGVVNLKQTVKTVVTALRE